ncbi:hypothetical protein IFM89_007174 [Coptis chinensis]|uniref:Uncharacterized protein n=1 Tax=Coptis chinensis TaxID=261450 RepID=A0A835HB82_9MAGN|nr:hypothetical protein IFM89_007174 [Coptis chinensis]
MMGKVVVFQSRTRIDEAISGLPFLLRRFSEVNKITTTVVKEILNQIVDSTNPTDIEDVVRLLVIFMVMIVFYFLCEHVKLCETVRETCFPRIAKWSMERLADEVPKTFKLENVLNCHIRVKLELAEEDKEALYPEHHQSEAESLRRENAELKRENEELRKLNKDLMGELGRLTRIVCVESLEDMFENHEHSEFYGEENRRNVDFVEGGGDVGLVEGGGDVDMVERGGDVDMVEGVENKDVDLVEEEGKRESELSKKELAEKEDIGEAELSERELAEKETCEEEEKGEADEKEKSELDGEKKSSETKSDEEEEEKVIR